METFRQTAAMNILLPLLHLDSARGDIAQFLNSRLEEVYTKEESKVLIEALTERLTNLQSQTWRLVRSSKLSNLEVTNRVMIALLGTQPLVVNYHSGVFDGVTGRLRLTPPGTKEPTPSLSEGMLQRFRNDLEHSVRVDDVGKTMGWSLQGGLHTEYTSDFIQRNRGEIHCVFHDSLLPNLIRDLDTLYLSEPASPPRPQGRLDSEQLLEQVKEMRVEGRKTLFLALVDCAKGFLSAEERDRMANFIQPDPAPLPIPPTTTAPVVTTLRGTPLGLVYQPLVTTVPVSLPIVSTTMAVTATLTPATITPVVITTTAATLVVSTAPMAVIPQGGTVSSTQQFVPPVVEVTEAITVVMTSGVSIPSQSSTAETSSFTPAAPGVFPLATQSHSKSGTSITPSGHTHPVSHPIVIQPSNQRLASGVLMGVEGLTIPLDPVVTVTATVARLFDPMGSRTSIQGLASHQAAVVTSQEGISMASVIGTIHGPGLPRPITDAGGSTEPIVSASTSQVDRSQVFMIVEDDEDTVEIGTAEGFT